MINIDGNLIKTDGIMMFEDQQVGPVSLLELLQACCSDSDSDLFSSDMAPTLFRWNGSRERSEADSSVTVPLQMSQDGTNSNGRFWYKTNPSAEHIYRPPSDADRLLVYCTQRFT